MMSLTDSHYHQNFGNSTTLVIIKEFLLRSNFSNPLKYIIRSILGKIMIINRKDRPTRIIAVINPVAML